MRLRVAMGQRVYVMVNGETMEILLNQVNGRSVEVGFNASQNFRILSERNYNVEKGKEKQQAADDKGHLWKGGRDNTGNL